MAGVIVATLELEYSGQHSSVKEERIGTMWCKDERSKEGIRQAFLFFSFQSFIVFVRPKLKSTPWLQHWRHLENFRPPRLLLDTSRHAFTKSSSTRTAPKGEVQLILRLRILLVQVTSIWLRALTTRNLYEYVPTKVSQSAYSQLAAVSECSCRGRQSNLRFRVQQGNA